MRVQVVPESLSIYYHLYMYTSVPHACSIHYEVSCGLNPALLAVGLGVPSRFRDRGPRAALEKKKEYVSYHISGPGGI